MDIGGRETLRLVSERDELRSELKNLETHLDDLEEELAAERNQVQELTEKLGHSESRNQSLIAEARRSAESSITTQEVWSICIPENKVVDL